MALFYWLTGIAVSVLLPTCFLWWLSQRSPVGGFLRSFAGVQSTFMGMVSIVFSLNLAFLCNEVWQARESARTAMGREAEALRNIARMSANIPDGKGAPVLDATRRYLEAALAHDFHRPDMRPEPASGASSLGAVIAMSDLAMNTAVLDAMHPSLRPVLIAQVNAVRDRRLERIAQRDYHSSWLKWGLLIALELVAVLSIALVHINQGRALFIACLLFMGSINPFLAVIYNSQSPFSGIDPLPQHSLEEALVRVKAIEASYRTKS